MTVYKASGEQGIWFAKIEDLNLHIPCVWNYWVKPSESGYSYDDEWIQWKDSKGQLPAYIKAIKEGRKVCHTVGEPIDKAHPMIFRRLGYDSVWTIVPDEVNKNIIRFRFERKLYDLCPRASGHEAITPYPATR